MPVGDVDYLVLSLVFLFVSLLPSINSFSVLAPLGLEFTPAFQDYTSNCVTVKSDRGAFITWLADLDLGNKTL